jgi:hypothetical protein
LFDGNPILKSSDEIARPDKFYPRAGPPRNAMAKPFAPMQ